MEDIGGKGNANKGKGASQDIASPSSTSEQEQPNQNGSSHADKPGNENKPRRRYFRELLNEGPDRHIELLLTIAIATFSCFQLLITCSNNASNSKQTERLLQSANRVDEAAESFSRSASGINGGVTDAAVKLNEQVDRMDASVKAANKLAAQAERAAHDSELVSYRDLRPYVQVVRLEFAGNPLASEKIKGFAPMFNSGRTPATYLHGCGDITILPSATPMTDDLPCPAPGNPKRTNLEKSDFVLGSGSSGFTIESPGTNILPSNFSSATFSQLLSSGALLIYFYGEIGYSDLIDPNTIHHTKFCGRYQVETNTLVICEKHNKSD